MSGGVTAARSVPAALVGDTDPPAPATRSSKATHLRNGRTSDRVTVVPRSVMPPPAAKSAPARPLHSKLKRCSHSIEPTSDRLPRSPEASCRPQRRNRSGPSLTLQAQTPPTFELGERRIGSPWPVEASGRPTVPPRPDTRSSKATYLRTWRTSDRVTTGPRRSKRRPTPPTVDSVRPNCVFRLK
jgi:hypothetical protein